MRAIRHQSTGEIQFVETTQGYGPDWVLYGPELPTGAKENLILVGGAWIEDVARVRSQLLTAVKVEAETRKMGYLSPGGAKKAEYAQKAAEVSFYDSLGGTVTTILAALLKLSASQMQAKFGYALADAQAFGDPNITNAIERFRAGMTGAVRVPSIAAAEAKACATIKAATTAAAARAAYSAAMSSWPTT